MTKDFPPPKIAIFFIEFKFYHKSNKCRSKQRKEVRIIISNEQTEIKCIATNIFRYANLSFPNSPSFSTDTKKDYTWPSRNTQTSFMPVFFFNYKAGRRYEI
jgi:hypothetical protein